MLSPRMNKILRWICYAVGSITIILIVVTVCPLTGYFIFSGVEDAQEEATRAATMQQVPPVEIEFAKVKQAIFSVTPYDAVEQKEEHYAVTLKYAPGCFRVGETWLFKSLTPISKVIEIYSKTRPLSGWSRHEQYGGGYGYISSDGKWQMSVEQDKSENGQVHPGAYVVDLYYTSPSFWGCT